MALTVPFTEAFQTSSANWYNAAGTAPLSWAAAGGPDGSSFAETTFNFVNSAEDDGPAIFRGQDEFNSSGGAFVGDWVSGGVTTFTAYVRHDAGVPLPFFVRFSSPFNFPGGIGFAATPVESGTWQQITIPIGPAESFIYEGPSTYASVFGNLGHIQIGLNVPASLAGVDRAVTFAIDQPTIVPEPSMAGLMALAATTSFLGVRRQRRRPGAINRPGAELGRNDR